MPSWCRTCMRPSGSGVTEFLGDDLVAQVDALITNSLAARRGHGRCPVALFAAETALLVAVGIAHRPDGCDGRADRQARVAQDRAHAGDALVADVDAGSRDQFSDLMLVLPAERTRQQPARTGPAAAPAPAILR